LVFLEAMVAPDNMLICVASADAYHLGVLSSAVHVAWALAAGGRLGVGNDPRYNKTRCFDPFPFPVATQEEEGRIADLAERLDAHRNAALERDNAVTMTGMYNVVEKLRTGEPLTPKERKVHEVAACGVLGDLHAEVDRLVAEAYDWPWPMDTEEILARLVALHDERVEEERRGIVRWLRPDYQIPRFGEAVEAEVAAAGAPEADEERAEDLPDWPADAIEQLTALRAALADQPETVEEAAGRFRGARRAEVEKHLETLEVLGVVTRREDGRWQAQGVGVLART
jgi:DNA-binding transcriptional ArsR family regulator